MLVSGEGFRAPRNPPPPSRSIPAERDTSDRVMEHTVNLELFSYLYSNMA